MICDSRKLTRILTRLEEVHGEVRLPARRPDPLDALVRTVLSQNTTDRNRDRAFDALRAQAPTWEEVARLPLRRLATLVKPAGLHQQKAGAIRRVLQWTHETFGKYSLDAIRDWETSKITEALIAIKGVGIKTVNVVLSINLGRDVFPLDTHCLRLLKRLGCLPPSTTLEKAHKVMKGRVPKGRSLSFHINLIRHGRTVCAARKPLCGECGLRRMCPKMGVAEK